MTDYAMHLAIRREGLQAAEFHLTVTSNPYTGTSYENSWLQGYRVGRRIYG